MASRTQLRLGQITGSFGDFNGGIIDTRDASGATSINNVALSSGSMVGVLSELASSIARIHGAQTFASNVSGQLIDGDGQTRIVYTDGVETALSDDGGNQRLSIGANIFASASFVPNTDLGQDLGTSAVHWGTLHVGQVDATGITGSINTSISNNQVVIADANGVLEGDANLTFDGTTLTLGSSQDLSVGRNATIAGNLTVQGTTTTIDTQNLSVQDPFILLGGLHTAQNSNSGIIFTSGSSNSATGDDVIITRLAADTFGIGSIDSNSGSITDGTSATSDIAWRAQKFEVAGTANTVAIDSSNLTATAAASFKVDAATDIILDADSAKVILQDNGTEMGRLTHDSVNATFILSSSGGDSITLESRSGEIFFNDQDLTATAGLNAGTANEIKFGHTSQGTHQVGFLNLKTNAVSVLSASSGLQIDAGEANGQLQLLGTDGVSANLQALSSGLGVTLKNAASEQNELQFFSGSNYVALKSPADLSGNVTLVLPVNDGDANQVLQTDGSGNLSFATAGAGSTSKGTIIVTGSAVNNLEFGSVTVGDNISGLGLVDQKLLDVYVNGQLLTTGSQADVETNGVRDYRVLGSDAIRFAFDLEADDVVVVIKRG